MKIFYDYKIFYKKVRGGPSRLFLSLAKNLLQYDCNIKFERKKLYTTKW